MPGNKKNKIALTGGGTAGHVMPHIALLPHFKKQGWEIIYIGSKHGIENTILPQDLPYYAIQTGKLRRYFDLKNFTDVLRLVIGFFQSLFILFRYKPNLLFSKGGFVSVPVVWAAGLLKIPIFLHESDLSPGLANKLSLYFAKTVFTSFPDTRKFLGKYQEKAHYVGLPIRDSLLAGSEEKAKELLSLTPNRPVILIMGGSLGAQSLNSAIDRNIKHLTNHYELIHIRGKGQLNSKLQDTPFYHQFEYVSEELPHFYKAAHLFIGRAGANTLFELLCLKLPSLLVPLSKEASRGDQLENSKVFQENGWAHVWWPQEAKSFKTLPGKISAVLEKLNNLKTSLTKQKIPDSIPLIIQEIQEHLKID